MSATTGERHAATPANPPPPTLDPRGPGGDLAATDQAPPSRPWQASIHAELSRVTGIDALEEIVYENGGRFTWRSHPFGTRPGFGTAEVLNGDQLSELLDGLRAEQQATLAGVDLLGLEVFIDLIEDALRADPPSSRFDQARFGAVTKDETRHVLYGHVGLGVDVAGTVRDVNHELSFEQHVVMRESGPFRPLTPADRASLVRALTANPPADPSWQQVLQDASSNSADVAERYVRRQDPRFVAAGGTIAAVIGPAAELLPSIDVFSFAVGSQHPLSTSPQARHTILVDRGERLVALDLDATAPDATVAALLRGVNVLRVRRHRHPRMATLDGDDSAGSMFTKRQSARECGASRGLHDAQGRKPRRGQPHRKWARCSRKRTRSAAGAGAPPSVPNRNTALDDFPRLPPASTSGPRSRSTTGNRSPATSSSSASTSPASS
jgi:hypothetical protein